MSDATEDDVSEERWTDRQLAERVEVGAAELEAEVRDRYHADEAGGVHPAQRQKYEAAMEIVENLRAAARRLRGGEVERVAREFVERHGGMADAYERDPEDIREPGEAGLAKWASRFRDALAPDREPEPEGEEGNAECVCGHPESDHEKSGVSDLKLCLRDCLCSDFRSLTPDTEEREAKISLDGFQQDPLDALDLVAECAAHTQMEAAASSVAVVRVIRDRLADAHPEEAGGEESVANLLRYHADYAVRYDRAVMGGDEPGDPETLWKKLQETELQIRDRLRGAPEGAGEDG